MHETIYWADTTRPERRVWPKCPRCGKRHIRFSLLNEYHLHIFDQLFRALRCRPDEVNEVDPRILDSMKPHEQVLKQIFEARGYTPGKLFPPLQIASIERILATLDTAFMAAEHEGPDLAFDDPPLPHQEFTT